jgi:hypothetical protein
MNLKNVSLKIELELKELTEPIGLSHIVASYFQILKDLFSSHLYWLFVIFILVFLEGFLL